MTELFVVGPKYLMERYLVCNEEGVELIGTSPGYCCKEIYIRMRQGEKLDCEKLDYCKMNIVGGR